MPALTDNLRDTRLTVSNGLLMASFGITVAFALAAILVDMPMLAIGCLAIVPVTLALLCWPDSPTPVVLFILYSNVAVVAVRSHGVPSVVSLLIPLALAIPLVRYLLIRRDALIVTPAFPLIVIFIVIQMLGTLFAANPRTAISTLTTSVVEGLALYFIITNVVRTPQVLKRSVWALLAAGAVMGGVSVHQQLTKNFADDYGGFAQVTGRGFLVETQRGEVRQPRLCGPIGEQNRYAQIMLMLAPLGLFCLGPETSRFRRGIAVTATAVIVVGGTLAFSRGAALGVVLMLAVMTLMRIIKLQQTAYGSLIGVAYGEPYDSEVPLGVVDLVSLFPIEAWKDG